MNGMTKPRHNEYPHELTEYRQLCKKEDLSLLEILAPIDGSYSDLAMKSWVVLHKRWHRNPYNIEHHRGRGFRFWWLEEELARIKDSRTLPKYMQLKESDKATHITKLKEASSFLINSLKNLELDGSFLYCHSKLRGDFHIYEDQQDKIKLWFDEDGSEKILLSLIIEFATKRAIDKIKEAEYYGKQGKNALAVIFLRRLILAHRESHAYGTALYGIAATFTNLLYDTNYDESAARKLMSE